MTRLALLAVVWLPPAVLFADEPKTPLNELQGSWQEPVMRGEDPSLRYAITFEGERVTIRYREQVLTGTVVVSTTSDLLRVTLIITKVEGEGSHVRGTYSGLYEVTKDRVSFHFNPVPVAFLGSGQDNRLRLAPVTLTLHRVKE